MAEGETVLRARFTPAVVSVSLATMLLMTAAAVGVHAMTFAGHAEMPQSVTDQTRRSVEWKTFPDNSPSVLWIVSTSVDAPAPDEFQITYNHGSFSLAYERTAGGPVTNQFTVTIAGLVEWLPTGDEQFSDGTLVEYTQLGASAFGRLPIVHSETTTPNGVVVDSFLIQSNSGEITMNLTISQGFVTLPSGSTLTPMEAELSFQLNHLMNRTDTRLSIQLAINTESAGQSFNLENETWDEEYKFSQDERAVNVTNDSTGIPSSSFFAWSNHAEVNGQPGVVNVTGPETNDTTGGYDLYLSYPRIPVMTNPHEIEVVHDPTLGVVSAAYQSLLNRAPPPTGIQADIPLYAVTMAAVAALVAGTILLTRRQRREGP